MTTSSSSVPSVHADIGNDSLIPKKDANWKSRLFCSEWNTHAENFDRLFKVAQGISETGRQVGLITGHENPVFGTFLSPIDATRSLISVSRLTMALEKLVTGKMFFKTCSTTGKWTKASDPSKRELPRDFANNFSEMEWRNPIDIIMDIILLVARIFIPINWMNRLKLVNLGKHSVWTGIVVVCAFTSLTLMSITRSIASLVETSNKKSDEEDKKESIRQGVANLLTDAADLLAMPWDNGVGLMHNRYAALAGAILLTFSGAAYLIKEWIYYKAWDPESAV